MKRDKMTKTKGQAILYAVKRFLWLMAVLGLAVCSLGVAVMTVVNIVVKRTTEGRIITADQWATAIAATESMADGEDNGVAENAANAEADSVLTRLKALDADCILVLGAGVREDGSPSLMLGDRLNTSISLYETGICDRVLMSGDHGREEYDEVNVMKGIAVEAGIPSEHVFMDHAGFSTYDSLYRAKHIFQVDQVIIVTQEYHLYRALYIAKSLGLEAIGVAAPGENYYGQTYREVREMAARTKDFAITLWKPEASIMGEAIPVSGDGNVTNDK